MPDLLDTLSNWSNPSSPEVWPVFSMFGFVSRDRFLLEASDLHVMG